MTTKWNQPGPTAVLEHALIRASSRTSQAGPAGHRNRSIKDGKVRGKAADALRQLIAEQKFNHLAMKLGVKVIHCKAERDIRSRQAEKVDEFVNTWSGEGFPRGRHHHGRDGLGHARERVAARPTSTPKARATRSASARMGINTWVCSWVPDYCIHGMVVRHGEAFTISDRLTVGRTQAIYRPTAALRLLPGRCGHRVIERAARLRLQAFRESAHPERRNCQRLGYPGALLMGHAYNAWWNWQVTSASRNRAAWCRHQNATTIRWLSRSSLRRCG